MKLSFLFLFFFVNQIMCVLEPQFQWKYIDYLWGGASSRENAIKTGDYIPENNLPFGLARWKDKLFITVPRIKKGVPSSLNYIMINGAQDQLLRPYPNWDEGFIPDKAHSLPGNRSVVCTFKIYVDSCDRLWVVDNGVTDITGEANQIAEPAIMVFDLKTDQLVQKFVLKSNVFRSSSIFTSIVVDTINGKEKNCSNSEAFAYITDMGSNALVVFSLKRQEAWRFENPYFYFDPSAGTYKVGGIDFFLSDGISSAALSNPDGKGYRDLYFHPTSSSKLFKISTKLLMNKDTTYDHIFNGVNVVGDKGDMSQATACDFDPRSNVLFYTQLSKYGVGCWNANKPFTMENNPIILRDCFIMEFPSDVKVDHENNLWMLSNRQARFLFGNMDFDEVNFRILTAPVLKMIQGSTCEKRSFFDKAFSSCYSKQSSTPKHKDDKKTVETSKNIESLDQNKDDATKKTFGLYDRPNNLKDDENRKTCGLHDRPKSLKDDTNRKKFGPYDSAKNLKGDTNKKSVPTPSHDKDRANGKSIGAVESPSILKNGADKKSFNANDSPRKSFGKVDSRNNLKDGTIRKSYNAIDSRDIRKDSMDRKSIDSTGSYQKRIEGTKKKPHEITDSPRKSNDANMVTIITVDSNKHEDVSDRKTGNFDNPNLSKRKDAPYKLNSFDSVNKQQNSKKKETSVSKAKDELVQCSCDNDRKTANKTIFHKNYQDEYEDANEEARSVIIILPEK